uniref:Transmembrane protein 87A n=1 Tax=Ditylenchus dipsaci TaxID=166011 RepID=A0A915DS34_9BILA
MDQNPRKSMEVHNVTEDKVATSEPNSQGQKKIRRLKRTIYPGLNGNTIDGGASKSLTSWHPVQTLPADSIYILVLKISVTKFPVGDNSSHKIETEVQWRGPHGFLSAIDYPLLRFYGFMCFFYMVLAMGWMMVCIKYWKDLLRIQFWIGAVILVGMIEKAVFYEEYANMNETGRSIQGLLELAELTSCLKRTMAHVLIIIVSVGFGVVKPRLGATLNQVTAVGIIYFIFCSLEGLTRVSKQSTEAMKEKQIAKIPLALLEVIIAWWIFSSLVSTMRALRLRRNEVKLSLYRHFTNVLGIALTVAVCYMVWSLYLHIVQYCMKDWKELWVDTAFWHIFFCTILVVIMFLWRPSCNNQRYAFTPLLDDSEDENEDADDELFSNSQSGVYALVKQRGTSSDHQQHKSNKDEKLEDDLKWIENNIPSSLAEALIDEDDDKEQRELEMSKML